MDLKTFKTDWNLLTVSEKDMLKVMTIAYEPLSRKNAAALFNETRLRTMSGLLFSDTNLRPYLLKLMSDGWINEDRSSKSVVVSRYREWVMRMAVIDERFKQFVHSVQKTILYKQWSIQPRNFDVAKRDLRIAFYQGDLIRVDEVMGDIFRFYASEWAATDFFKDVFAPFDAKWVGTFPLSVQSLVIRGLMEQSLSMLESTGEYLDFISNHPLLHEKGSQEMNSALFQFYLFSGEFKKLETLNSESKSDAFRIIRTGVLHFLRGKNEDALTFFAKGVRLLKKQTNSISAKHIPHIEGLFHVLAIMKSESRNSTKEVHLYKKLVGSSAFKEHFNLLDATVLHSENHVKEVNAYLDKIRITSGLQGLFFAWTCAWTQFQLTSFQIEKLDKFYQKAKKNKYAWLEMELGFVLARLTSVAADKKTYETAALKIQKKLKVESVLPIVKVTEAWERSLKALTNLSLVGKRAKKNTSEGESRLIWLVDFERMILQPKEQKLGKSGNWSKGRNVSLKRLKEEGLAVMTEQDNKVKKAIKRFSGYWGATEFDFDFYQAARILVGHPLLFLYDNTSVSVDLIYREPELVVEEIGEKFEMRFIPSFQNVGVSIIRETPTRYLLLDVTENHMEILRYMEGGKLKVPKKAKKKLIEAVGNVSSAVTVHSVVGGAAENMPTVEGDATTFVHLLSMGDGFKLEFFVKPFKTEPPYFKPGSGRNNVIAEIDGEKKMATRALIQEKENASAIEHACPTLLSSESYNQAWGFDDIEKCLNVLLELEPLREEGRIILEYPKGEKVKIIGQASFGNLSMNVKKKANWFQMDGEVKIDEDRVMDFTKMLALAEESDSRFLEVSKGQFIAITEQLRQKLNEFNSLLNKTKDGMQLHPLAMGVLDDFSDELADFQADKAWKKNKERLNEALTIDPKVPSTFKAELRDYQLEGYRWLNQLAHWGVGACLADDMGLGKTVQGLALILNRAKNGPAMVVAPASVARNWLREAQKFTPTLNPILFGTGDRIQAVADLKPFDLLITSYGLMQQESELLATTTFSTLVLDEAQAIKNKATKRSKAAMELQSDFRVTTTGTPIENHLGELWNLFNFLNPGLLGSLSRFNEKFAVPIEKNDNKEKRMQLQRLIRPFILRRRKVDVLSELPPKTEITLSVELSKEERAFYEALRRKAIDKIESTEGHGAKRFQVLAELMRLRQACCNVKMIQPTSQISSSKLELFAETVSELIANGHKALIFSQFVKHLRLVEEWVKQNNISYQYLDGQTPTKKREEYINAFQEGEGDLFLISLKAGGTGLNLTAADYVIHLDPWWNPAVEDQASDRAHRIGQQRPVTIYRLVAEETIEEKIVQLHGEKRDLADSLLEGTEASAKLGADDLLGLIKGEF